MTTSIPTLCGSVSGRPSRLGLSMHNAAYEELGLDYRYVALSSDNLAETIAWIEALGFRGLGVSTRSNNRSCNTWIRSTRTFARSALQHRRQRPRAAGRAQHHWLGALGAFDELGPVALSPAVVAGAGGVARAIAYGLARRGAEVFVCARDPEQAAALAAEAERRGWPVVPGRRMLCTRRRRSSGSTPAWSRRWSPWPQSWRPRSRRSRCRSPPGF